MPEILISLQGLEGVKDMLDDLATKEADRIIRKALRAGAKIEQAAIQERAPVRPDLPSGTALPPGALAADVTIKTKKIDNDTFQATIGPGKLTSRVSHLVEFGHRMVTGGRSRLIKKGRNTGRTVGPGKQVGMVPAHPYTRPAFEASVNEAVNAITKTLQEEVTKTANKKK
jgi:HK97 gp10 family phage protein